MRAPAAAPRSAPRAALAAGARDQAASAVARALLVALRLGAVGAPAALLAAPASAAAQEIVRPPVEHTDRWSDPNPGIRHLVRTTTLPSTIHALVVDLTVPGVRVRATPYDERWRTVSAYAQQNGLAAATNGGFWGMLQRAEGIAAGGGARWPDGEDDDELGFFAVTRDGRAWISPPEQVVDEVPPARLSEAVSGQPLLVRDGRVDTASLDAFDNANLRHPRSAVGVSRDGTKVILIVADGRQDHSRGMTLYELARLFVELGAHMALNLDGGGSSAMYLAAEGGIVNSPSGGRWEARLGLGASARRGDGDAQGGGRAGGRPGEPRPRASKVRLRDDGVEEIFIRGNEREVMNHIGVVAPLHAAAGAADPGEARLEPREEEPAGTRLVIVEPPRPPVLALGRSRELLFPLAAGAAVALPAAGLGFWLWRRRRRAVSAGRRGR
jgi:hypothetical protein